MFPRIITHKRNDKTYSYLHISESIRKDGKSTTRDIANLGNIARFANKDIENIIDGLIKIFQLDQYSLGKEVQIVKSLDYGNIIFWQKLWNKFKLSQTIKKALNKQASQVEIPVEKYVEMMVINRCINPSSKLGITRWLEGTCYEEMDSYSDLNLDVNYFYRSMDHLIKLKDEVECALFDKLKTLFSVNVRLTFYDITSTYIYGQQCPIAEYGYSRDHRSDCKQIIIGIVTSYEGYPIKHYIFEGNVVDSTTVQEVIKDLNSQFNIEETIFVGDRGMITKLNLQSIEDEGFSYIMGVKAHQDQICQMLFDQEPIDWTTAQQYNENLKMCEKQATVKGFLIWKIKKILEENHINISDRKLKDLSDKINSLTNVYKVYYKDFKKILENLSDKIEIKICKKIFSTIKNYQERYEETLRFVFCLNPEIKEVSENRRVMQIKEISDELNKLLNKTKDAKKSISTIFAGYKNKYRKFFNLNENSEQLINYSVNQELIEYQKRFDGVFVLRSNKNQQQISTRKIVESYKNLKEIEMLNDDLKNFVDVRPIRHWLEERVKAHVFICVLALLLKRTLEINYLESKEVTKPLHEISKVKLIKYRVKFSNREERYQEIPQVTSVNAYQKSIFHKIGIKNPMNLEKFMRGV